MNKKLSELFRIVEKNCSIISIHQIEQLKKDLLFVCSSQPNLIETILSEVNNNSSLSSIDNDKYKPLTNNEDMETLKNILLDSCACQNTPFVGLYFILHFRKVLEVMTKCRNSQDEEPASPFVYAMQ